MLHNAINMEVSTHRAALHVLHYYSLFHYPLTDREIFGNAPEIVSFSSLQQTLANLCEEQKIYQFEGYYCLDPNISELVEKREAANKLASVKIKDAEKVGRLLYYFPFVKSISISGSLSKGYADHKIDYDFFIITDHNRLWICRTILHLFKKISFLTGQQYKLCMNYFIDTHNLEIEEKNNFTAIELSSLVPVAGFDVYAKFITANAWKNNFLPNGYVCFFDRPGTAQAKEVFIKKFAELVINIFSPGYFNKVLMKMTDKKWRRKWRRKNFPMEHYDLAFKTTLHISKNHPANYQQKVLNVLARLKKMNP